MKRLSVLLSLLLAIPAGAHAASVDPYEELASRLTAAATKKLSDKKIAVLTFEYVDGRSSTGARAVAEKLTNRFVELGELTVIERGMVEKVMKELEFQNRGTVDPEGAKKLGKGLGVEAIVTGTLEDAPYGNVEVNARIIKTESYEIIAAATMKVKKTWSDQPAPEAQAPQQESSPVMAPRRSSRPGNLHGFFDIMLGISNATMDAEFTHSTVESSLDFGGTSVVNIPGGVRSVSLSGLATGSSVPFGVRVGGFGQLFGGDFEFGFFSHGTSAQRATFSGAGVSGNLPQDWLHVGILHFSGDLLMRFPTGDQVIPYFGLGMGLSINNISSSYIKMNNSLATTLSETAPGFLFRVPFGVRFNINNQLAVFGEGRFWMNTFSFTRNISGESDSITMQGFQFLTGLGFLFG